MNLKVKKIAKRVAVLTALMMIIIVLAIGIFSACSQRAYGNPAGQYNDATDDYFPATVPDSSVQAVAALVDTPTTISDEVYDYEYEQPIDDVIYNGNDNSNDSDDYGCDNEDYHENYENHENMTQDDIYNIDYIYDDEDGIYEYENYDKSYDNCDNYDNCEIVMELPQPLRDPHEKLIALTFDDGPSRHTQRLLDILAEYDAAATFFVLGGRVWDHRYIMENMIAQGSEAAGHSWHHADFTRLDEHDIEAQITYTDNAIAAVTGKNPPSFFRAPFGHFNDTVQEVARGAGVALIQWSINPNDWRYRNAQFIYDYIMANAFNGGIVLLHDIHETTVDAMEMVIPSLIERGYRLVTVSYLLGETVPGRIYYCEFRSRD